MRRTERSDSSSVIPITLRKISLATMPEIIRKMTDQRCFLKTLGDAEMHIRTCTRTQLNHKVLSCSFMGLKEFQSKYKNAQYSLNH